MMSIDLIEVYLLNGMKRGTAKFVAKCPNCYQVKVEHQNPGNLAQNIKLLEWKLDDLYRYHHMFSQISQTS